MPIGTDLHIAQQYLREGKLVAIPTETVYGLAGNALNDSAVVEIFRVKNRPAFDPLIVHTDSLAKIENFVSEFPDELRLLAERFWPGSLTILLPKRKIIPDLVTSGLPQVGVRVPNHPLTLRLLSQLDFPLAAPSANPFGYISPTTAAHVATQLSNQVPYILDGGACDIGVESTIVGLENNDVWIYRLGGIAVEAIETVIGPVKIKQRSTSNPQAPGMLLSHYAPRIPLSLEVSNIQYIDTETVGYLGFMKPHPDIPLQNQRILSPSGNLTQAAHHLFAYMRALDTLPISQIFAELLPEVGLGRALNDRLRRAATSTKTQ